MVVRSSLPQPALLQTLEHSFSPDPASRLSTILNSATKCSGSCSCQAALCTKQATLAAVTCYHCHDRHLLHMQHAKPTAPHQSPAGAGWLAELGTEVADGAAKGD